MHALPPPLNVILGRTKSVSSVIKVCKRKHVQIRINTRDVSFSYRRREGGHPTFGFEFQCIFTPGPLIQVTSTNSDVDRSSFGDGDFFHCGAINSNDWVGDREYIISLCPFELLLFRLSERGGEGRAYSRATKDTVGYLSIIMSK